MRWPWLAILLAGTVVALWSLAALGAWLFVKYRRDFATVQYIDLVWPGRWEQHRQNQGRHYINQAEALLQQGDYVNAVHKLRAGVSKAPDSSQGRLLLARVYAAYRRPDLAQAVLLDGLPHLPGDRDYLQTTLGVLLEFQEDAKLLQLGRELLAAPERAAFHPLIATFSATAAYYRGNYDEAETLLDRYRLGDSPDGAILRARIAWDRGFPELALVHLKAHLALNPGHDQARALLADYYRALGRINEWESALVERVAGDPLSAAPRVAYLQLHHRRGDQPRLERETAAFLEQFGRDPLALLLLGDYAANTGQPNVARRVQQHVSTRPEHAGAAALMVAEAYLVAGEHQAALDLVAGYAKDYPEWSAQFAPVFNGLQAVALTGLGRSDEARLSLDHLLAQKNLRAENLVAVAGRLSALGARDLARSTLNRASEADPLNQPALANLIRLELEMDAWAELPDHLRRFIHLRLPSREILARAHAELGGDRHLLLPGQQELLASLQSALNAGRP